MVFIVETGKLELIKIREGDNKCDLKRNFFSQRVPGRWNLLPESTRQKTSVLGFKAAIDGTTLRQPGLP